MTKLTWLVTGCSSGFGKDFVHSILARGDNVIATGRKAAERLAHLKDTGATILDLDMSTSEEEINTKAQEALKIYDGIDVLVNNAGYIDFGFVEDFRYAHKSTSTVLRAIEPSEIHLATTAGSPKSPQTSSAQSPSPALLSHTCVPGAPAQSSTTVPC